jgi:hypothetical protein
MPHRRRGASPQALSTAYAMALKLCCRVGTFHRFPSLLQVRPRGRAEQGLRDLHRPVSANSNSQTRLQHGGAPLTMCSARAPDLAGRRAQAPCNKRRQRVNSQARAAPQYTRHTMISIHEWPVSHATATVLTSRFRRSRVQCRLFTAQRHEEARHAEDSVHGRDLSARGLPNLTSHEQIVRKEEMKYARPRQEMKDNDVSARHHPGSAGSRARRGVMPERRRSRA